MFKLQNIKKLNRFREVVNIFESIYVSFAVEITNDLSLLVVISQEILRGYVIYATLGTKVMNIFMYSYVHL